MTEIGYWEGDTSSFTWERAKRWYQERTREHSTMPNPAQRDEREKAAAEQEKKRKETAKPPEPPLGSGMVKEAADAIKKRKELLDEL